MTNPVVPSTGRRRLTALAMTAALGVLGACGGGGGAARPAPDSSGGAAADNPSSSSSAASPAPPAKGAVNPNGPEVSEAGDIPDNQVFVDYRPPSGGYSVAVPEGWARLEEGGAVTFTDKLNRIRLETVALPVAPTVQSVTQNDLPAIRAAAKNFEAGTVKTVPRRAGTAVLATYRADAPADPVTGKVVHDDVERYEFWRNGTAVIVTLSCPKGADNVDPWRTVTDSFTWR